MTPSPNLRNRAWLLGLLTLANRAGLRPVPKSQLHSLVFLANSLAPIYEDTGVDSRVIRYEHGPFYPDAQWDLDRMAAQGLLRIEDIRYERIDTKWWLNAAYSVTDRGEEMYARCGELPLIQRSYRFLLELVNAFASLSRDSLDTAPLQDAIYRKPGQPNWAPLVFDDPQDNYAVLTAQTFDELVGPEIRLAPKERLDLYFDYLGRLASRSTTESGT